MESVYENALCIELESITINFECQKILPVFYKGREIGNFKIDILVEDSIVLELKSTEKNNPLYEAQILSYMKMGGYRLGLLMNFNNTLLKDGIKRFII